MDLSRVRRSSSSIISGGRPAPGWSGFEPVTSGLNAKLLGTNQDRSNPCNLGGAFGVYNLGVDVSGRHAGANREGGICRRGSRAGRGRKEEEVMVYRPFSYLSPTSHLPFS